MFTLQVLNYSFKNVDNLADKYNTNFKQLYAYNVKGLLCV